MPHEQAHPDPEGKRPDHWNGFYRVSGALAFPSQFAVFVCDYLQPGQNVIEFGCGNGRDALFFASQGFTTVGFDAAEPAIALCRSKLAERENLDAEFHCMHIRADWADEHIAAAARTVEGLVDLDKPSMLYARFFLHAITPEEQRAFLALVRQVSRNATLCAVEFRTHRDQYLKKETSPHYRRYIDPSVFHAQISQFGLQPVYFVEGFGLAKYKADDAHVARFIIRPRESAE